MTPPPIILYGYRESPFYQKLLLVLLFKQLPYSIVKTGRMPPRLALSDDLGITYRRIPVIAIGNDVYCDTSLAFLALDKLECPREGGAGTELLSKSNYGIGLASSFFWSDRAIFKVAVAFMPREHWTPEFVKDRSAFSGGAIDPVKMELARPMMLSSLRSHMSIIEIQLATRSSPTKFILNTDIPTYLDISLFFTLNWIDLFKTADSIFKTPLSSSPFPLTLLWISQMRSFITILSATTAKAPIIPSHEAAQLIHSAIPIPLVLDPLEPLLVQNGGWLMIDQEVEVTPDDSGRIPQKGILVALNPERSVLQVSIVKGDKVRVHFPRLGFGVSVAKKIKLSL